MFNSILNPISLIVLDVILFAFVLSVFFYPKVKKFKGIKFSIPRDVENMDYQISIISGLKKNIFEFLLLYFIIFSKKYVIFSNFIEKVFLFLFLFLFLLILELVS
jgi:hypothetical protein